MEIRAILQQLTSNESVPQTSRDDIEFEPDPDSLAKCNYEQYLQLLLPLDRVRQDPEYHPEGDVLYHSLQVFELAREALPWDEDFLIAALLHDVGKGIDPFDYITAGLTVLQPIISERTFWLIENHSLAQSVYEGTIGVRARRRIRRDESGEELELLARCDQEGRVPGRKVCSAEDAIDYLRSLSSENSW